MMTRGGQFVRVYLYFVCTDIENHPSIIIYPPITIYNIHTITRSDYLSLDLNPCSRISFIIPIHVYNHPSCTQLHPPRLGRLRHRFPGSSLASPVGMLLCLIGSWHVDRLVINGRRNRIAGNQEKLKACNLKSSCLVQWRLPFRCTVYEKTTSARIIPRRKQTWP